MNRIVHPLTDELGALVENDRQRQVGGSRPEPDTSWRWMVVIAAVVGLLGWLTR